MLYDDIPLPCLIVGMVASFLHPYHHQVATYVVQIIANLLLCEAPSHFVCCDNLLALTGYMYNHLCRALLSIIIL